MRRAQGSFIIAATAATAEAQEVPELGHGGYHVKHYRLIGNGEQFAEPQLYLKYPLFWGNKRCDLLSFHLRHFFWPDGRGVGRGAGREAMLPDDTCIVDLHLPAGARTAVDGSNYGINRRLEFSPLKPGEIYKTDFKITLTDSAEILRTVLLKGGWRINLALPTSTDQPELVLQTGQQYSGSQAAISPSGRYILTASSGKAILWDLATGRQLRTYATESANYVAFSPDGQRVVVTAQEGREAAPSGNAKSPESNTSAFVPITYSTIIFDTVTGKRLRVLPNFPSVISLVAFSPDGQQIITAGSRWDQTVKKTVFAAWLWDLATGTRLQSFNLGDKTGISLAAFSDDGRQVMLAIGGELSLWDPATGEKIRDVHRLKSGIFSRTSLSPDGRQLLWQHGSDGKAFEC